MMTLSKIARLGFATACLTLFAQTAHATDEKPKKGVSVKELETSPAGLFCNNIREAAREKRYALKERQIRELHAEKTKELTELKERVEKRISALEVKRAEYEEWVSKRAGFLDRAEDSLVQIYAKMRPDAAASRLEILEDLLAAAILMKLTPAKAGVILNEMKPESAAKITQVIAATGSVGKKT